MTLDTATVDRISATTWRSEITPALQAYIRIPAVSMAYDAEWSAHGHIAEATTLLREWAERRTIDGLRIEVQTLPGRTPLIVGEIPATRSDLADDTVVLYGHYDKQPEMTGWRDDLGPWTPVIENGRLYGRGGADDGYSMFASLAAVEALREAGGDHARLLLLIEASEESGSPDLPAHLDALGDRLGAVSLVIGLDSGCATYDRLWATTSLRGNLVGDLRVDVLDEGVHSGAAGGVVPSSFRLLRRLLDRVEDPDTGRVLVDELACPIPDERVRQMQATADEIVSNMAMPWAGGTGPVDRTPFELLRAKTWEPAMANVGIAGFPPIDAAGNVLRPSTTLRLSFRLAPEADPDAASEALRARFEADPPHGAPVSFTVRAAERGWNAPATDPWLSSALDDASTAYWGRSSDALGEGGTIPFMGMLGAQFPDAQFLITGVLGPGSNAHGPNEFLDLTMGQRITAAVSTVLDAHARRHG